ncbi:MAG: hypothetical protein WBW79_07340 [Desulfocapsaceae bacterium]
MDEYSWGHNRPPKGLPIEGEIVIQKVDKRIPHNPMLPSGTLQTRRTNSALGYFVICKAYKEPQPLNLVEDLLLQRNFIID